MIRRSLPPLAESGPEAFFYLEAEDILGLYAALFGCSIQQARDQVRDWSGLESAASRPRNYALYQDADLALQAAVLAHAIAEGQPFIDGNKRAAGNAMLYFLTLNGFSSSASQGELALWLIQLSAGLDVEALADRIRATLLPRSEA
jgi:death-on-curing family protein